MGTKGKRAALYVRVSTDGQTVENQRLALEAVAERRGWAITAVYEDSGISGAKGRERRPGFDGALKDATRGKFDVLMVWSIDRLGRSTAMVATALAELEAAGVAIYADKEAMDATSPHGRAMLQMAAVFAELERGMIRERVIAGLARAKATGTKSGREIGRPKVTAATEEAIGAQLTQGRGIVSVAKMLGVGVSTVQRVSRDMRKAAFDECSPKSANGIYRGALGAAEQTLARSAPLVPYMTVSEGTRQPALFSVEDEGTADRRDGLTGAINGIVTEFAQTARTE